MDPRIARWNLAPVASRASRHPRIFRYGCDATVALLAAAAAMIAANETGLALHRAWCVVPTGLAFVVVVVRDLLNSTSDLAQRKFVTQLLRIAHLAVAPPPDGRRRAAKTLRLCVIRPDPAINGTLRVWVAENFGGDHDSDMLMEKGTGVAGWVYTHQKKLVVDRVAYPKDPRFEILPLHSAAAARKQTRTFFGIPVFDPSTAGFEVGKRKVVAILCCDSDLALEKTGFESPAVDALLTHIADFVAVSLIQE